jgi:hypothetical protein
MHVETQFSVFMVNKPGVLAQVLNQLAEAHVNIVALTMMDSVEHGVMRVVTNSVEKTRKLLAGLNMPYNESEVLCVNLPNHSGAFAAVTQKLAEAHVNISYAYCTAGARGGRTTGILKVADVGKAMKILESGGAKTSKSNNTVKRAPGQRR